MDLLLYHFYSFFITSRSRLVRLYILPVGKDSHVLFDLLPPCVNYVFFSLDTIEAPGALLRVSVSCYFYIKDGQSPKNGRCKSRKCILF